MSATLRGVARGVSVPTGIALMACMGVCLSIFILPSVLMSSSAVPAGPPSTTFGVVYEPDATTVRGADGFENAPEDVADRITFHYRGEAAINTSYLVVRVGDERYANVTPDTGGTELRVGGTVSVSETDRPPTGTLDDFDDRIFETDDRVQIIWTPPDGTGTLVFSGTIPDTNG